jgi:cytochrome c-type biogenesis protein CcmE
MSTALKIAIVAVVVVVGVGFLAFQSLGGSVTLYNHVDEVVANPNKFVGRKQIQVHGFARKVPSQGRIDGQRIWREFEIESKGAVIQVRHEGVVPDTFKEQAETVVTGQLASVDGRLVLTTVGGEKGIMAKCPSKYEEARKAGATHPEGVPR